MSNIDNNTSLSKLLDDSIKRGTEIICENKKTGIIPSHIGLQTENMTSHNNRLIVGDLKNDARAKSINRTTVVHEGKLKFSYDMDWFKQTEFILNYTRCVARKINSVYNHIARLEIVLDKLCRRQVENDRTRKIRKEIEDEICELESDMSQLLPLERVILKTIKKIGNFDEIDIVIKGFLEGYNWSNVIKSINMSDRSVFLYRKKIITKMANYFEELGRSNIFEVFGIDPVFVSSDS